MNALFQIGMFILAVVGSLWFAFALYLEYHAERKRSIEELVDRVVHVEGYQVYLKPLLFRKLREWQLSLDQSAEDDMPLPPLRDLYVDMRMNLQLTASEYDEFVDFCTRVCRNRGWHGTPRILRHIVDDACCDYMWNIRPLDDLWSHLERLTD